MKLALKTTFASIVALGSFALISCNQSSNSGSTKADSAKADKPASDQYDSDSSGIYSAEIITEREVVEAQREWGEGIVRIGKVYSDGGDYRKEAADFIEAQYAFDLSLVLFKPTLASVDQFRNSFDAALSYFVAGNDAYPEDKGFAIAPYTKVTFDNSGIINNSGGMAVAMGNYFFTGTDGKETKVEYTFAYVKDKEGKLRIVTHSSHIPYSPPSE